MATVTFGTLWISPADDLSAGQAFPVNAIEHDPTDSTTTRGYAGGNYRAVRGPGRQKIAKVNLGFLTDAQTAQLKDWQGLLLLYRDPTGEKFYGIFSNPTFTPRPAGNSWAVPLTVQEVTVSEEV